MLWLSNLMVAQDDGGIGQPAPHTSNNRAPAAAVLAAAASAEPTFSVEQQYMLLDPATRWPLGECPQVAVGRSCRNTLSAGVQRQILCVVESAEQRLWLEA